MKRNDKGITLIALIVMIVVLLILAGITLGSINGHDGIIEQTGETAQNAQKESIIQKIEADLANEKIKKGEKPTKEELKTLIQEKEYASKVENDSFTAKDGGYTINFTEIEGWKIDISEYLKVGDYVSYEPTKMDVKGTLSVDSNKLTYTSPVGGYSETLGKMTHGNGNSEQTFTAKTNNELKWRVLSIAEDSIELISDTTIATDSGSNFILQGGVGYLYAEQELNEVCKIYGYGYGADTNIVTNYTIGGPDYTEIGKIKETGARSITIEDLNKKAGIYQDTTDGKMKYSDGIVITDKYGNESFLTTEIYYPTLKSTNTNYPGQSANMKLGFEYTYYSWHKSQMTDTTAQKILFGKGEYWLASRCMDTADTHTGFVVRHLTSNNMTGAHMCNANKIRLYENTVESNTHAVRPIVTIKSEVIDIFKPAVDANNVTVWNLK